MNRRALGALGVGAAVAAMLTAAPPATASDLGSQVGPGTRLVAGDRMVSDNGAFTVTVQTDGNVVERKGATAVWVTGTRGYPGAVLDVQTDGNVVVRSAAGRAVWTSGTAGRRQPLLVLSDDGELALQAQNGSWSNDVGTPPRRTALAAGQSLRSNGPGDAFVYSPSGRYEFYALLGLHVSEVVPGFEMGTWAAPGAAGGNPGVLTMQTDGNLVYRDTRGTVLWATGTHGAGYRVTVQDDGNVVMRRPDGAAVWATATGRNLLGSGEVAGPGTRFVINASRFGVPFVTTVQGDGNVVQRGSDNRAMWQTGTAGNPGAQLIMQTDGNMVVRRTDGRPVWQSGTNGCGRGVFDAGQGWIFVGGGHVWTTTGGRTC